MSNERELFEKWVLEKFGDGFTCADAQLDMRGDEYIDFHAQDTWSAWQASAQREGLVLVPVEPSEPAVKKLGNCIFDNFGTTKLEVKGCAILSYKTMIKEGSVK